MTGPLSLGTRGSPLARAQTELVVRSLRRQHRRLDVRVRPIVTRGDRDRTPGGSPDFTGAIDQALLEGDVDLAVHSAKDLPSRTPSGLSLVACPRRADPRDCLVTARLDPRALLPRRAVVGSSSPRRRAQLLRWRPDLGVVEIRGNVDTRLRRVKDGEFDAIVVAAAGLRRLGRSSEIGRPLPVRDFLPAPAQGALAVLARSGDVRAATIARTVDHRPTHAAVDAERAFAAALGGDCRVPMAALARVARSRLELDGEVLSPDGKVRFRARGNGPVGRASSVGEELAAALLDRGAGVLLSPARP